MMKLDDYNKEELVELIIAYNEYQKECPKDEQLSIGSFILSNGIAKLKYKDNKEEYEKNKYPKIKTVSDKLQSIEKVEELRKLFIKPIIKPRFKIDDTVEDIINKQYYYITAIIKRQGKIFYRVKNGPVTSEIEEKYLALVSIINGMATKDDGIIITQAKRV